MTLALSNLALVDETQPGPMRPDARTPVEEIAADLCGGTHAEVGSRLFASDPPSWALRPGEGIENFGGAPKALDSIGKTVQQSGGAREALDFAGISVEKLGGALEAPDFAGKAIEKSGNSLEVSPEMV